MTYSIAKKEVAPQPVLVERKRVAQSEIAATIGDVVGRLFHFSQREGLVLTGTPFTRYLEVGPGLLTIEPGMRLVLSDEVPHAAEALEADDSTSDGVRRDTLPGGFVATTVHQGPYETLNLAYAAIEAWIEAEGLTVTGAPWESYITFAVLLRARKRTERRKWARQAPNACCTRH